MLPREKTVLATRSMPTWQAPPNLVCRLKHCETWAPAASEVGAALPAAARELPSVAAPPATAAAGPPSVEACRRCRAVGTPLLPVPGSAEAAAAAAEPAGLPGALAGLLYARPGTAARHTRATSSNKRRGMLKIAAKRPTKPYRRRRRTVALSGQCASSCHGGLLNEACTLFLHLKLCSEFSATELIGQA